MPKITASSPVLLVADVERSVAYYRDCVGFKDVNLFGEPPVFAIVRRDGHYLMLAHVDDAAKIVPHWKVREKTCGAYYWVDAADALYDEMKSAGAMMDYGPCDQPYGVREFGIQDPDGHDVSFGQVMQTGA